MTKINLDMPRTKTPGGVFGALIALAIVGCIVFCIIFDTLDWGWFWGVIVMLGVLGITTDYYTETVPGFYARIVLNHIKNEDNQRTIFQGLHFKLPWESVTRDVDLRAELNDVCKDETYTAKDSQMKVKYVYTLRPDISGDDAGEMIIRYASFEPSAIKQGSRATFSRTISDYFVDKPGETLLQKSAMNKILFEGSNLDDVQEKYGIIAEVTIEDVDFDEATQSARDTKSRAKSLREAVNELMVGGGPDGKGMSRDEAEKRAAELQNLVQENLVTIKAEGIPEGTNIALVPTGLLGGKKGKGKNK